jgi:hypothetical protein
VVRDIKRSDELGEKVRGEIEKGEICRREDIKKEKRKNRERKRRCVGVRLRLHRRGYDKV